MGWASGRWQNTNDDRNVTKTSLGGGGVWNKKQGGVGLGIMWGWR